MRGDVELVATAPELFVSDFGRSLAFYETSIGATVIRREPDGFAVLRIADSILMLASDVDWHGEALPPPGARGGGLDVRILVAAVDAWYYRVAKAGVPIVLGIGDREYGLRDFIVRDPDGYRLRFASPIPEDDQSNARTRS